MQFVKNGPEVPAALLKAHEDGKVVFFCGAGVSYPAGLPTFKNLVDEIYNELSETKTEQECQSYKEKRYDQVLSALEARIVNGRAVVRRALFNILQPDLSKPNSTLTHESILTLATSNKDESTRLVTTNFDRIFELSADNLALKLESNQAPFLPIPKPSKWSSIVYLHGLLPEDVDDVQIMNRLVLTSGDFGSAYLTERWASRFVGELLRGYEVCFIGYSIEDQVVRYMMDALAADKLLGEKTKSAWAFGASTRIDMHKTANEWKAKGVVPVLYEIDDDNDHSLLHSTLEKWSALYRDGIEGKERYVTSSAHLLPVSSTKEDNFIGRMLWALFDESGIPAKSFAQIEPPAPLEWFLDVISKPKASNDMLSELSEIGFNSLSNFNNSLFSNSSDGEPWGNIETSLSGWLVKHLDDARLLSWVLNNGQRPVSRLKRLIEQELVKMQTAPNSCNEVVSNIPTNYRSIWNLIISDRVRFNEFRSLSYDWIERFKAFGKDYFCRLMLREIISPKVLVSDGGLRNIREEVRFSIETTIAENYFRNALEMLDRNLWSSCLPFFMEDFERALLDAVELQDFISLKVGLDESTYHMPSIEPHFQNRGFHDWTILIELTRDSWLELNMQNQREAFSKALEWFSSKHVVFKRLALFAAANYKGDSEIPWLSWLESENGRWLWEMDTKREVMRLIVKKGNSLSPSEQRRLESLIVDRTVAVNSKNLEVDKAHYDFKAWYLLAKLESSGVELGEEAAKTAKRIKEEFSYLKLGSQEEEEFSTWMSTSEDPGYVSSIKQTSIPTGRNEIVQYFENETEITDSFYRDNWYQVAEKHPLNTVYALDDLYKRGIYDASRWNGAIQAWSKPKTIKLFLKLFGNELLRLPSDVFQDNLYSISVWIRRCSELAVFDIDLFTKLCQRFLEFSKSDKNVALEEGADALSLASSPLGQVSSSIVSSIFHEGVEDGDGLKTPFKEILEGVLQLPDHVSVAAKVVPFSNLVSLHRLDSHWTSSCLIPLLDINNSAIAPLCWQMFLSNARIHPPLLEEIKGGLLELASNINLLGRYGDHYVRFIVYLAMYQIDGFTSSEFRNVIDRIPQTKKNKIFTYVRQFKGNSNELEFWENRVEPFWEHVWPKDRSYLSSEVSESLVNLIISSEKRFERGVQLFSDWLEPMQYVATSLKKIVQNNYSTEFPEECLALLYKVTDDKSFFERGKLKTCLSEIKDAKPELENDFRYKKLMVLTR